MSLSSSTNRRWRYLKPPFGGGRIGYLSRKIFLWAISIDLVIVSGVFIKLFVLERARPFDPVAGQTVTYGPATGALLQELKSSGLDPSVLAKVSRHSFTVEGRMIAFNNDNIQAFEYPDHESALRDASSLANRYMAGSGNPANRYGVNVFIDGSLVIFYMGNQVSVMAPLEQIAGLSLTQPEESLSFLSQATN